MTDAEKLEKNIRQMRATLERIRDEAAIRENGGSWSAGVAALSLAILRFDEDQIKLVMDEQAAGFARQAKASGTHS